MEGLGAAEVLAGACLARVCRKRLACFGRAVLLPVRHAYSTAIAHASGHEEDVSRCVDKKPRKGPTGIGVLHEVDAAVDEPVQRAGLRALRRVLQRRNGKKRAPGKVASVTMHQQHTALESGAATGK